MKEFRIPFKSRFIPAILESRKTMTSRFRRYGAPGDWFTIRGRTFILTDVEQHPLGYVALVWWRQEGVGSEEEFWDIWRSIHPGRTEPGLMVWVHRWRPA